MAVSKRQLEYRFYGSITTLSTDIFTKKPHKVDTATIQIVSSLIKLIVRQTLFFVDAASFEKLKAYSAQDLCLGNPRFRKCCVMFIFEKANFGSSDDYSAHSQIFVRW